MPNGAQWMEGAMEEAWSRAQKRKIALKSADSYIKYRQDPVGFGEELLGESYTDDAIAVMESVRDNVVTIARSANGVGKSHAAARVAMHFFTVYDDAKVYITAAPPVENLRQILWGEIVGIIQNKPSLVSGFKLKSLSVIRNSKSFITGVAIPITGSETEREAKFAGKHAPHLLFIVDEGDAVPDEVYKGIESCMSSGGDKEGDDLIRLLILFNPRERVGPLWEKENRHEANVVHLSAFTHPNVVTGKTVFPGAVSRATTVRRINSWSRPLAVGEEPGRETYEVPDFLVGTTTKAQNGKWYDKLPAGTRKVTNPAFSYMVLGIYPAQSAQQLISQEWVDKARTRYDLYVAVHGEVPPSGIRPRMGLDLAEFGPDPNVVCFRYGGYVSQFITWNGVDSDASALRALELYLKYDVSIALVDATGVGSNVAPAMVRRARDQGRLVNSPRFDSVRAMSVKVGEKPGKWLKTELGEFMQLRDQLWWAVREWLREDDTAMLPDDRRLLEDLTSVSYEKTISGKIKVDSKKIMRKRLKRSTDRGDALALTFAPYKRPIWMNII